MKALINRFMESPVTKLMGFSLFILVSVALYNGKFELMYSGVTLYLLSLSLLLFSTKQIKGYLSKALNAALDFFKKSAPIIALAFLITGCGMLKSVNKTKEKESVKTDSVAHVKEKETVKTKTVEQADTSAVVKGSTVNGSTLLTDLNDKPLVLEDENQVVTVKLDSTGKLKVTGKVKDRKVDLKFTKTTEEVKQTEKETKVTEKKEQVTETKTTDKDVRRYGLPWWFWLLLVVAGLFIARHYLRKVAPWIP